MSRTYKDRPTKVRFKEHIWSFEGEKTKKRKEVNTEYLWCMSTPSWWTRMMMNRPQRREYRLCEREIVKTSVEDLDDVDVPDYKKKPHIYYW